MKIEKIRELCKASYSDKQMRLGLICLFILLIIIAFAPYIANFNPYEYGDDILFGLGKNGIF